MIISWSFTFSFKQKTGENLPPLQTVKEVYKWLEVRDCHAPPGLAMTHKMAFWYVIGRSGTTDVHYRSRLMLRGT